MTLIVKNVKREFELPDEGAHLAKVVEARDLGSVQTKFGLREMVLLVFEVEQTDGGGNPRRAFKRFSKTLHPKGALRKAIRSITGEDPGDEYDLAHLIGRQVRIVVEHEHSGDSIFANITALLRVKTNEPPSGASAPAVRTNSTGPKNGGVEALIEDMPEADEAVSAVAAQDDTNVSRQAS